MQSGRSVLAVVALVGSECLGPKLEAHEIRSDAQEAIPYCTSAAAEVALYDLFTGQCVFAWPSRDGCAAATSCPARP